MKLVRTMQIMTQKGFIRLVKRAGNESWNESCSPVLNNHDELREL